MARCPWGRPSHVRVFLNWRLCRLSIRLAQPSFAVPVQEHEAIFLLGRPWRSVLVARVAHANVADIERVRHRPSRLGDL